VAHRSVGQQHDRQLPDRSQPAQAAPGRRRARSLHHDDAPAGYRQHEVDKSHVTSVLHLQLWDGTLDTNFSASSAICGANGAAGTCAPRAARSRLEHGLLPRRRAVAISRNCTARRRLPAKPCRPRRVPQLGRHLRHGGELHWDERGLPAGEAVDRTVCRASPPSATCENCTRERRCPPMPSSLDLRVRSSRRLRPAENCTAPTYAPRRRAPRK